jgi:hypothetical protein
VNTNNTIPDVGSLSARDFPNVAFIELYESYWQAEIEALVHGPIHSSIGQEAVAVGVVMALRQHIRGS